MKHISSKPLHLSDYLELLKHPKAGAVVTFCGDVRNHNNGDKVDGMEYHAHDSMANKMIAEIIDEAIQKFSLHFAFAVHRVGSVAIAETAVIVLTGSSHRKEAFEANQYIIERIKYEAPIWKKEFLQDGTAKWGTNSGDMSFN